MQVEDLSRVAALDRSLRATSIASSMGSRREKKERGTKSKRKKKIVSYNFYVVLSILIYMLLLLLLFQFSCLITKDHFSVDMVNLHKEGKKRESERTHCCTLIEINIYI